MNMQNCEEALLRRLLEEEGRPALLAHLKAHGVSKVGERQRIANEMGRAIREPSAATTAESSAAAAALPPPPPPPPLSFPLVFVHIGHRPYVECAVRVTSLFHKPIVVLGDQGMAGLGSIEGESGRSCPATRIVHEPTWGLRALVRARRRRVCRRDFIPHRRWTAACSSGLHQPLV